MRKWLVFLLALFPQACIGQVFSPVPYVFAPNTPANASQLMANFQSVINNGNAVASSLQTQISAVTPPPSGAILFFYLSSCPTGWTLLSAYANLFIRGLDLGRGMDTTATTVGNQETGGIQAHKHASGSYATSSFNASIAFGGASGVYVTNLASTSNPQSGGPGGSVGSEVRPKNVSLLLCVKN